VTRSLAPAKVVHIEVFENETAMTVAVEDDKLSLAIGRNGQNARLASKLAGWKINIMSESEYNEMKKREAEDLVPVGNLEGIGAKLEERLVTADITTVQKLAKSDVATLIEIEGIGQKTAETLIEKAKAMVTELAIRRKEEDKRKKEQETLEASGDDEESEKSATAETDEDRNAAKEE